MQTQAKLRPHVGQLTARKLWRRSKVGYTDLSNMTYPSILKMMFLNCFYVFLRERFGVGLGSGLGLGIGLVLGDGVRVKFEVRVRSILFICTTVIENVNRKSLPCVCGILE